MFGYTFEVVNKKTGNKYLGKRYAASFSKDYFGEQDNDALAKDIEKYGRPSFEVKMIMPYETIEAVDAAYTELAPVAKPKKKEVVEEVQEEVPEEAPVEKKPPKRKKKSEEQ